VLGPTGIPNNSSFVESADEINFKKVQDISYALDKTSLKENKNYLVSGMSVLVVSDPEDSESTISSDMQKAIGYLFSEKGPFSQALVLPKNDMQKQNLIDGGAQVLIADTEGFDINTENPDFTFFVSEFLSKFKVAEIFPFFVALATRLRWSLDIYNPDELDGYGFGKNLKEFLKGEADLFCKNILTDSNEP